MANGVKTETWESPAGNSYPSMDAPEGESFPVIMTVKDWETGDPDKIQDCPVWHRIRREFKLTKAEAIERGLVVFRTTATVPMPDSGQECGFVRKRYIIRAVGNTTQTPIQLFDDGAPTEDITVYLDGPSPSRTKDRVRKYQATQRVREHEHAVIRRGRHQDARRSYTREFATY